VFKIAQTVGSGHTPALENEPAIAALYDRTGDEITLDAVERIAI